MATPVTDSTCLFGPISNLAPTMQTSDSFCHGPPLTLPKDCPDGGHLLRLPASLQAKQVEQAMAWGLHYMGLGQTGVPGDLISSQVPAIPDILRVRKYLIESDVIEKLNELQLLQMLVGNTVEYSTMGSHEPAMFGSYETISNLSAHRSTPMAPNPFDLASLKRDQPLAPVPLNTKKLNRRTNKPGSGLELADPCIPRKQLRSSNSVPTPSKSAQWVNPSWEARPTPPSDATKATGTGVFLPPPSSGTGVFMPSPQLATKVAQKERGCKNSKAGEGSPAHSDSASTASSFDYLPEVSEVETPKSGSPPAPSTPQAHISKELLHAVPTICPSGTMHLFCAARCIHHSQDFAELSGWDVGLL